MAFAFSIPCASDIQSRIAESATHLREYRHVQESVVSGLGGCTAESVAPEYHDGVAIALDASARAEHLAELETQYAALLGDYQKLAEYTEEISGLQTKEYGDRYATYSLIQRGLTGNAELPFSFWIDPFDKADDGSQIFGIQKASYAEGAPARQKRDGLLLKYRTKLVGRYQGELPLFIQDEVLKLRDQIAGLKGELDKIELRQTLEGLPELEVLRRPPSVSIGSHVSHRSVDREMGLSDASDSGNSVSVSGSRRSSQTGSVASSRISSNGSTRLSDSLRPDPLRRHSSPTSMLHTGARANAIGGVHVKLGEISRSRSSRSRESLEGLQGLGDIYSIDPDAHTITVKRCEGGVVYLDTYELTEFVSSEGLIIDGLMTKPQMRSCLEGIAHIWNRSGFKSGADVAMVSLEENEGRFTASLLGEAQAKPLVEMPENVFRAIQGITIPAHAPMRPFQGDSRDALLQFRTSILSFNSSRSGIFSPEEIRPVIEELESGSPLDTQGTAFLKGLRRRKAVAEFLRDNPCIFSAGGAPLSIAVSKSFKELLGGLGLVGKSDNELVDLLALPEELKSSRPSPRSRVSSSHSSVSSRSRTPSQARVEEEDRPDPRLIEQTMRNLRRGDVRERVHTH